MMGVIPLRHKSFKSKNMKTIVLIAALFLGGLGVYAQSETPATQTRKEVLDRRERRLERKQKRIERRNPEGYGLRDNRIDNRKERVNRRQNRVENRGSMNEAERPNRPERPSKPQRQGNSRSGGK